MNHNEVVKKANMNVLRYALPAFILLLSNGELGWPATQTASAQHPNCAVTAVYAACRSMGATVSLESVNGMFPEEYRKSGVDVPMRIVLDVLSRAGLQPTAIQYTDVADMSGIATPSIVLIFPQGMGRHGRGHYVLLTGVTEHEACLIDSESSGEELHMPKGQMSAIWSGHAIVFNRHGISDCLRDLAAFGALPAAGICYLISTLRGLRRRGTTSSPGCMDREWARKKPEST